MSETDTMVALFYASADVQFGLRLAGDLHARGIDADGFDDLMPNADARDVLVRHIEEHNTLLVVVSPAAARSPWMARVGDALAAVGPEKRIIAPRIAPLDGELPPWISDLGSRAATVDFTADYDSGLRYLLAALSQVSRGEHSGVSWPMPWDDGVTPQEDQRVRGITPPAATSPAPAQAPVADVSSVPPSPPPAPSPPPQPRGGVITGAPAPSAREVASKMDDEEAAQALEALEFTAYHPREIALRTEEKLLFFLALVSDETRAQIEALAAEQLRERLAEFRAPSAPANMPIARGTKLTITPHVKGIAFDPASINVHWTADVQSYAFTLRAEDATAGHSRDGFVDVFEGPILRAAVPISFYILGERRPAPKNAALEPTRAAAYRNTFPSYARRDERIVRAVEAIAEAGGDRFLRDVRALRAGEHWAPKLLELIDRADVFQLFWSKAAARSEQVEREWRHALALLPSRPGFIRPIYWDRQLYTPPKELQPLDFGRLEANALGLERGSLLRRLFGIE